MGNLVLLSSYISVPIWSGNRLARLKGLKCDLVGESWEVSRLEGHSSSLNGAPLSERYSEDDLPYLVKFIDTSDDLSLQVHPNDEYAHLHENSVGKDECWLILAAEPDATILLGLRSGTTREEFQRCLLSGGDPSHFLVSHQVSVGDFFYVPAGTLHAIGKGILLIEVQKGCGITYRVWDYHRVGADGKPRALHITQALDVIDFSPILDNHMFKDRRKPSESLSLLDTSSFKIDYHNLDIGKSKRLFSHKRVGSLVVLEGELLVRDGAQELILPSFQTVVIDPNSSIMIEANCRTLYYWIT